MVTLVTVVTDTGLRCINSCVLERQSCFMRSAERSEAKTSPP